MAKGKSPVLKQPAKVGRYTFEGVAQEIARAIERHGRGTHTALATHLGIRSQQLNARLAGTYARFDVVELGLVADFFAGKYGVQGYCRGWPLLSYEESMTICGKKG
jgi:hypothetical protein